MKKISENKFMLLLLSISPFMAHADGHLLEGETIFANATFNLMLGIIVFLLLIIYGLTRALKGLSSSDIWIKKNENNSSDIKSVTLLFFLLSAFSTQAEVIPADHSNDWKIGGLDAWLFYFLLGIIMFEGIVILILINTIKYLVKSDVPQAQAEQKKEKNILEIINASVAIENEEEIMMDHDYDGIKELDNDLPPWWRYGFYLTIFIGVIYLIHFHISLTGDLQITEYNKEVAKGKADVEAYMKEAAVHVDENTVEMMSGADLEQGKGVFITSCAACHGKLGGGGVGPNLTDSYWLHDGSLAGIFKTIKYGWPDKGMKSWKEDLSPTQIAQVSSYIQTLIGTNPPNGKAPQGDLLSEKGAAGIATSSVKTNSLGLTPKADSRLTPEVKK